MINVKTVSLLAYLALGGYCLLTVLTARLNSDLWICQDTSLREYLPRTAGCYYRSYFQKSPTEEQIEFEDRRLRRYIDSGGAVRHLLWYRAVFYRRHFSEFQLTEQDLEEIHRQFSRAAPADMREQVSYFLFVNQHFGKQAAQRAFDYYCNTYILKDTSRAPSLRASIARARINLTFDNCLPNSS